MITRNFIGFTIIVALLSATPSFAFAQELKIGAVNLALLRERAPQTEEASRNIEREFADRQRALLAEQRAVQQLQEQLQRESDVITNPEEGARLERELRNRQRELQRNVQQYEEDLNIKRNEELGRLTRLVFNEIQTFAREENYDLLLIEGVAHASARVDVTDRILARLQALAQSGSN